MFRETEAAAAAAAAAAAVAAAATCRVEHVAAPAAHVWSEFHHEKHRSWGV